MALHRTKSRVRFPPVARRGSKTQGQPTRLVFASASKRALTSASAHPTVKYYEPSFPKKHVPSIEELQHLRSNLSIALAAANAQKSRPSSLRRQFKPLQKAGYKLAAVFLERVPSSEAVEPDFGDDRDGPPASLLATTALYRPAPNAIPCSLPQSIQQRQVTLQTPRHDPPIPTFLPVGDNVPLYGPRPVIDYRGYYSAGPDVFQPVQSVVGGFAAATAPSTTTQIRCIDFHREYLDRAGAPWGKWYVKHPTAETLPFAKAYREDTEPTELEVWDAHVAKMAQYREAPSIPMPEQKEDYAVYQVSLEDERAERLRYHTGHCFGAITGDVYPYQGGLIF